MLHEPPVHNQTCNGKHRWQVNEMTILFLHPIPLTATVGNRQIPPEWQGIFCVAVLPPKRFQMAVRACWCTSRNTETVQVLPCSRGSRSGKRCATCRNQSVQLQQAKVRFPSLHLDVYCTFQPSCCKQSHQHYCHYSRVQLAWNMPVDQSEERELSSWSPSYGVIVHVWDNLS